LLRVGEDSPARYGSTQESEACEAYALSEAHAMEYDVGEELVLRQQVALTDSAR